MNTEAPQSDVGRDHERTKKRKRAPYVPAACSNCKRSHTACSNSRPCTRCIERGLEDSCRDGPASSSSRKRHLRLHEDDARNTTPIKIDSLLSLGDSAASLHSLAALSSSQQTNIQLNDSMRDNSITAYAPDQGEGNQNTADAIGATVAMISHPHTHALAHEQLRAELNSLWANYRSLENALVITLQECSSLRETVTQQSVILSQLAQNSVSTETALGDLPASLQKLIEGGPGAGSSVVDGCVTPVQDSSDSGSIRSEKKSDKDEPSTIVSCKDPSFQSAMSNWVSFHGSPEQEKERKTWLRDLSDMSAPASCWDLDTGILMECNVQFQELVQYSLSKLRNFFRLWQLVPEWLRDDTFELLDRLRSCNLKFARSKTTWTLANGRTIGVESAFYVTRQEERKEDSPSRNAVVSSDQQFSKGCGPYGTNCANACPTSTPFTQIGDLPGSWKGSVAGEYHILRRKAKGKQTTSFGVDPGVPAPAVDPVAYPSMISSAYFRMVHRVIPLEEALQGNSGQKRYSVLCDKGAACCCSRLTSKVPISV